MKALVTGGAGFIGSHLADLLIETGHKVIVMDNLSNGRLNNINHLLGNEDFEFHELDITNLDDIKPIFKDVDWVFHMAGMADIVPSIENPDSYYQSNVNGTFNVLEACRKHNVKKIVYSASSSCYGIPDKYPTPENAEIRPQYPYALAKRMGEELVMHWAQVYNFPALSLRFFNVYGLRQHTDAYYTSVIIHFIKKIINY